MSDPKGAAPHRPRDTTRFAPSPTGELHLGHAHAALFAAAHARRSRGRFLIRLEDLDSVRCRPAFAEAALRDLAWLGLQSDEKVRRQSEHLDEYAACLSTLGAAGLVYPCFCTRAEVAREIRGAVAAPHAPDGSQLYPGTCRVLDPGHRAERLARGDTHCLRLDVQHAILVAGQGLTYRLHDGGSVACRPERFGDVVLGRRDMPASYHLAVTHDDAASGVTLVTRADDLAPATEIHRLLQALLGWPIPAYAFHRLLPGPDGRRLAKRDGATSLRAMREAGLTPADIRRLAALPDLLHP